MHTLDQLWPAARSKAPTASARYQRTPALAELPQPNLAADPAHPLYGQVVVFTGDLATLERDEAMQLVASFGATNAKNITKKTTMLVVGKQDATVGSVALSHHSGKERKALQYIEAGQKIRAVSEGELLRWLQLDVSPPSQMLADVDPQASRPVVPTQPISALEESAGRLGTVVMGILKWVGSNRR
ncbi:BRCT domain-containing protein [Arthrobacter parietis]|uniref:BRCT domain-containing protein n=1 Tax=Arthrobacter parietis TaxID=271434 RepID=UPI0031F8A15D